MRFALAIFLALMFLAGCAAKNSGPKPVPAAKTPGAKTARSPALAPTLETVGKIVSVNSAVRIAVLEFPLTAMPSPGLKMNVYRRGQKVGELKISGPQDENNIVADLTAGDAQTGDEVRND